MNTAHKPVWAGTHMRLDPFRLPQIVSYASRDDNGDVFMTIDTRAVVIKRRLPKSGLPFTIALPAKAFKGVAARAIDDGAGEVTVTLELLHHDPLLSVPLLVADNLEDVAADWRTWSERMGLPMLMVESDGVARALEDTIGVVKTDPSQTNRRRLGYAIKRPRFLMRRKAGDLGVRMVIAGDEIIARD
ncbi:MAG: DUF6101 family protein [Rhizobiaceae bacterium]